jgi:hypothetical protein
MDCKAETFSIGPGDTAGLFGNDMKTHIYTDHGQAIKEILHGKAVPGGEDLGLKSIPSIQAQKRKLSQSSSSSKRTGYPCLAIPALKGMFGTSIETTSKGYPVSFSRSWARYSRSAGVAGLLSRSATQMSMSLNGLSSRKDPNKTARTQPLPCSKDEILVIKACFSDGVRGGDGLFM